MDRHSMTSTAGTAEKTRDENAAADRARAIRKPEKTVSGSTLSAAARPHGPVKQRPLRSVASWTHELMLEGELTHRTAHALEVEIERLCEQGVTAITLDLRKLVAIDRVGVAVIAFRWRLCERRGYGFELIPGSRRVQREFVRAGVDTMLPFRAAEETPTGAAEQGEPARGR